MSETKPRASVWKLIAVAFFGFALTISGNTQDPYVYSHKVAQLVPGHQATALGFTTAAGLLVAVFAQPIIGVFSDRTRSKWGRRAPYFVAGTLGVIFCLYLIALAPAWWLVVAGILLIQFFSNTVQGPWQALIPDQIPIEQHGQAASVKGFLETLAAVAGGYIAGTLISQSVRWGEGAVIAAVSVPAVIFLIGLVITLTGAREDPAQAPPAPDRTVGQALARTFYVDFKSYPAFVWWFANRLLFWAGLLVVRTFLILFSKDVLGMTEADAQSYVGKITVVLGVLLILALFPAGWLSDRIGRKPLVIASGLISALGVALIVATPTLTMVLIGGGMVGLGAGMFISTNWALVTDIVPKDEAARYLGMANIATAGGSLLGRVIGGSLIDRINTALNTHTTGYLVTYAIAAGLYAVSALAILGLKEQRHAPANPPEQPA